MYKYVDGNPEKITNADFLSLFAQKFSVLTDDNQQSFLSSCIDCTYAMFSGVNELWAKLEYQTRYDKVRLCYCLLTAWYICDLFPDIADGVVSSSGIPLKSKSIANVRLVFGKADKQSTPKESRETLSCLNSNPFGAKALLMISSCPDIIRLR